MSTNNYSSSRTAQVWMGDIEPYMDDVFITGAFAALGYTVLTVKEIKLKGTGTRASYCFVDFGDVDRAAEVLEKLQNQVIPGTNGTKRFNIKSAQYGASKTGNTEYSLFVGDLSNDVTDQHLLHFFKEKYPSVRAAKIVRDDKGQSKGYGFVRFYDEEEMEDALNICNGATGLGQKPIKVNQALRKGEKSKTGVGSASATSAGGTGATNQTPDMSAMMSMQMMMPMMTMMQNPQMAQYMMQMSQYMMQCQQYMMGGGQQPTEPQNPWQSWQPTTNQVSTTTTTSSFQPPSMPAAPTPTTITQPQKAKEEEDNTLEDPNPEIDVAALNRVIVEREQALFLELEDSRWHGEYATKLSTDLRPLVKS